MSKFFSKFSTYFHNWRNKMIIKNKIQICLKNNCVEKQDNTFRFLNRKISKLNEKNIRHSFWLNFVWVCCMHFGQCAGQLFSGKQYANKLWVDFFIYFILSPWSVLSTLLNLLTCKKGAIKCRLVSDWFVQAKFFCFIFETIFFI